MIKGRDFPWRRASISKYAKVIAEVLLQRTRAETVSVKFVEFIRKYPSWKSIDQSSLGDLENSLKPFGLYKQRSMRLKALAKEMKKLNGCIPCSYEKLSKYPMIGQYIAYSILSIICNQPFTMLDVNMSRLLERYFGERKLSDIRHDPYLQNLAFKVVDIKNSRLINWAMLDYAAIVCKSKNPKCDSCKLAENCIFINK